MSVEFEMAGRKIEDKSEQMSRVPSLEFQSQDKGFVFSSGVKVRVLSNERFSQFEEEDTRKDLNFRVLPPSSRIFTRS